MEWEDSPAGRMLALATLAVLGTLLFASQLPPDEPTVRLEVLSAGAAPGECPDDGVSDAADGIAADADPASGHAGSPPAADVGR